MITGLSKNLKANEKKRFEEEIPHVKLNSLGCIYHVGSPIAGKLAILKEKLREQEEAEGQVNVSPYEVDIGNCFKKIANMYQTIQLLIDKNK